MTMIRDASTMYASMFSFVLFLILFEPRYSLRKTLTLSIGIMGPLAIANFIALIVLGPVTMGTFVLLTCSLPSLIFFWFLSKYRDGRYLFTFCFADTLVMEIIDLTSVLDFFLGNTYIFLIVSRLLLCPLLAFVLYKWIRPAYLNIQKKVTNGWYTFAAISLIFYVLMSMSATVPTHITERPEQLSAFILLIILLPFVYLHIFTTLYYQQVSHETSEKEKILSLQMTSLLSRVEEFDAANELLREERHDFRHKMHTIYMLAENGEYDQLKSIIQEYTEITSNKTIIHYCGHTLIDAVLSSYLQEAERKEIRVSTQITLPALLPVNESELATVFANAIENAIHACENIESDKRYIEIKAISVPRIMIQIKNGFSGTVRFDENGIPLSSSKDHGFGSRSIVTFCEKNNAFYEFITEEQNFIMKIIL